MRDAETYVRANAAKGFEFTLAVEAVEGDFARLKATPKKPDDGAIIFMKRQGDKWVGVEMGTAIACGDLVKLGFPASVTSGACDG